MKNPVFVIEHLDEEFFQWSQFEYRRIAETISPCLLYITNFKFSLPQDWPEEVARNIRTFEKSISELGLDHERICLMDSESLDLLQPNDKNDFDFFLLGGILGNVDEFDFDRTSLLRSRGFPTRNLGNLQMSTDTAAVTTKIIVANGIPFESITFVDRPEIAIDDMERIIMNFRYIADESGQPIMAPGVLDLIKSVDFDLDNME